MKGLAVLAVVLLAVPAFAQTTGRVDGKVTDDKGAALPGVTVTLTSPVLLGDRIAVTDADGVFRFLGLPPGDYSLKAQLEGFAILEQANFGVGLGRTVTLELKMSPAFGEEVTVSGAAPIIDSTSTTSGANFSEDLFQELPVSRTFTGLAFAAPGVVSGATGTLEDNPSISGASVAENRYVVDGLDTTAPAFGTVATQVPFEFIKEVEVKTGGYEAEFGGALGGVLNIVTKSGGNQFEGDVFGYWSDDSVQSDTPPTLTVGQDLGFEEYDFGAALGGKIIQDKLWYFVAANPNHEDELTENRAQVQNHEVTDRAFYAGKLTWQLNPNHQVVFSAFGDPTETDDRPIQNAAGRVANDHEFGATNFGVTYNGTLSSTLFLELSAGRFDENQVDTPNNNDEPLYQVERFGGEAETFGASFGCYTRGQFNSSFSLNRNCDGGSFQQVTGDTSRDEARGALTWFGQTGTIDHEIKVGATVREVKYHDQSNYPAPRRGEPWFDSNGGSDEFGTGVTQVGVPINPNGLAGQRLRLRNGFYFWQEYNQNSAGTTDETAVYLQDRVRFGDYFSLNLGVRADQFKSTGERSDEFPNRKLDFNFGDMVAPRVGFTWDVARNGRSKLYGHYGYFYESVPLDINARAFGNEQFNFYYFYYPEDGSLPTFENPGTHWYTYRLGTGVGVSTDIKPMYTTEALAGFEYEIAPNVAVGVKYTERGVEDVIEDISVDGGHTYFITNPGGTVTVNPVTGEPLDEPAIFPPPTRDYTAYELSVNKRFTNNWQLYGSYVNSKNEGNYGGLFRQDNGQLDPNITSLYDLPSLLRGAFGLLPNDREHQFKVYGSYLWPFKLVTGFYGQFLSGNPISKLGSHPIYGANERFVIPRGSAGRSPDIWNVDLHLEYPIAFGSGLELKLIADVFNITDQQEAATVLQQWTTETRENLGPNECGGPGTGPGTSCPLGNPNWGSATNFQQPRTLRLGVKLSF
jgi:outer membrane receptor protein involved in Fe transport